MLVLQIKNLKKSFGMQTVFQNINVTLKSQSKIALIGLNGSGKSTFLRCLTGELEIDQGEITKASGLKIGYLQQFQDKLKDKTLWDVAMQSFEELLKKWENIQELEQSIACEEKDLDGILRQYAQLTETYEREGGYLCEIKARMVLIGLGFQERDFKLLTKNLSGGQKTRLALACTLIQEPDVLFLDEPTNHLDIQAVEWLESYLKSYLGTLLFVSHDRMLVERIANGVWEMRQGKLHVYKGGYSSYLKQKYLNNLSMQRAWEKQQAYIKKTEYFIRQYQAGNKSKQARGRALQLKRLERLEMPQDEKQIKRDHMHVHQESGRDVLVAENISKAYQIDKQVLQNISFSIRRGEKVAIVGPNGCGKSTLLKILSGRLMPDSGASYLGSRVELAFFSQEFEDLHEDWTLFQEISYSFDLDDVDVRSCLGSMLFSEEDVFKLVSMLSGGEKGRLSLLKIMLSGANFLILDEPTNHLDMESREIVVRILKEYPGTLLIVSHDRYFIDQIVDRVIAFKNGEIELFFGNYSYYCEKMQEKKEGKKQTLALKTHTKEGNAAKQREEQKNWLREKKKWERQNQKLEDEIERLEKQKQDCEEKMDQIEGHLLFENYQNIAIKYGEICDALENKIEEWSLIQEEIEREYNDKKDK